jgi:hypothetical protein
MDIEVTEIRLVNGDRPLKAFCDVRMNYPAASSGVSNGIFLLFSPQAAGN